MKYLYKFLVVVLFLSGFGYSPALAQVLVTATSGTPFSWLVKADQGFLVTDALNPDKEKKSSVAEFVVTYSKNAICLNGSPTGSDHIILAPSDGSFEYAGARYAGNLIIRCDKKNCSLFHDAPLVEVALEQAVQESAVQDISQPAALDKRLYNVRVLLDEWDNRTSTSGTGLRSWELASATGFNVNGKKTGSFFDTATKKIVITVKHGALMVNGKRVKDERLEIVPNNDAIAFGSNQYQGAFLIARSNNTIYLMNSLDLEDYVFSVLRTESWPGWPLEVNKVFAIASRSYAIAMVMRSRTSKIPYHIKNTNAHQTYSGFHTDPVLKAAVEETKNVFLGYEGKPIIAMFDACCGGVIPAKIRDFNFKGAPYLKRPYACTYCKKSKRYSWKVEYRSHALVDILKKELPGLKKIRDIRITKKDNAGLVEEITIKSNKGYCTISGKKIYSVLKGVKSYCFSVHKHGDHYTFSGYGYGHHLGLCQWGAREMVRAGKSYKEILLYYYPNTDFMALR